MSNGNGKGRLVNLRDLPPDVAAAIKNGQAVDLQAHVPNDLQAIRQVNAFRQQINAHELEARELLDRLDRLGLERSQVAAYHARLVKVQDELAPIHAAALARVGPSVAADCERVLGQVRGLVVGALPEKGKGQPEDKETK